MRITLRWSKDLRERKRRAVRRAQVILVGFGILALGFCAFAYFDGLVSQRVEQHEFEASLRAPVPFTPSFDVPAAVRLQIPRLGISVMVHEGVQARTLRLGAGHIPGTAQPGEPGNIGIAAHRDMFFRELRNIQPQDVISLDTFDGTYKYAVEWVKVVRPSDTSVLSSSDEQELTLVTCYPFYYVGSASERFIVRARRVER